MELDFIYIKLSLTVVLPVVLYACETWSLTLREQCRLKMFENRLLRRICGPKRGEVTGEWRRIHNEEIYDLYSSPDIIRGIKTRRIKWGDRRGAYRVLVGKPKGRKPLEIPRRKWENNIKMDL